MTPSTLACGAGLMVALLDVMEKSVGGGVRGWGEDWELSFGKVQFEEME
ncbi:unnamed protein product [Staurois parvus]|uniref:Uncharacterized protein n=1 Tax=Staurois parvus TaxID=386267 RepID=A0ABN9CSZ4_9NEOB|nr:unnamed protein product [Staurois parvus]